MIIANGKPLIPGFPSYTGGITRLEGIKTTLKTNRTVCDTIAVAPDLAISSLRKLRLAYTGSAFRIRRDSDNAELDIGFDEWGNVDWPTAKAFVGAGNGFVSIWYDQSVNGFHATQTTAGAQPLAIVSGTRQQGIKFVAASNTFMDVLGGVGLGRNIAGFTHYQSVDFDGSANEHCFFISRNNVSMRIDIGRYYTARSCYGRRLDADGAVMVNSGGTDGGNMGVTTVHVDHANTICDIYLGRTRIVNKTDYLTAGSTSDTDSAKVYIGGVPEFSEYLAGFVKELVFYKSFLSAANMTTMQNNLVARTNELEV